MKTFSELREEGSKHYHGEVQPIDLYRSLGVLHIRELTDILNYAYRNLADVERDKIDTIRDMDKIIHCAELVKADFASLEPIEKLLVDVVKDKADKAFDPAADLKEVPMMQAAKKAADLKGKIAERRVPRNVSGSGISDENSCE